MGSRSSRPAGRPAPTLAAPPVIKLAGAALVLLNLMALAAATWLLAQNRRHYRERAEIQSSNLAEVLEENVEATVQQADLAVLAVKDEAEHDPGQRLGPFIATQARRVGILSALWITDGEGRVTEGTPTASPGTRLDLMPFLQALRRTPKGEALLFGPFQADPGGGWHLGLARRLEAGKGAQGGAVVAYLPLEAFSRILAQLQVGTRGSVSLRTADLSLLARVPTRPGEGFRIGDRQFTGIFRQAVQSGQPSVQFTTRSTLDGVARTYTLQRTSRFGLILLVGLSERDYLRPWWHQVALTVSGLLVMLSLTLILGWQARSAWIRQLRDQAQLQAEETKYRLLAENTSAVIWTLDPQGRLTFVSPSILRQRGYTPEEFMALDPSLRALSGDYAARIQARIATVHQLPPGSQPFEKDRLQTTVTCKDGREIQVEAEWRVVWGGDGQLLGFQGVTRDVTERRRMESERDALILELAQALAEVKTLSGLLPICSRCKKVRDDGGYWNQIESYLEAHSSATFTHGLCPDCAGAFREEMKARRHPETPEPD